MIQTRNRGIDLLKLILSLMIVAIHVFHSNHDGLKGFVYYWIQNGVSRIAVPTFFLISGYFLQRSINVPIKIRKNLLGYLRIFLVWSIIYSVMWLPQALKGNLSVCTIIQVSVYGFGPLWYLFALILGVGLVYLTRNWTQKTRFVMALGIFLAGYILWIMDRSGTLASSKLTYSVYQWIGSSRNFLFMAFPFLTLGMIFDYWKTKINLAFIIASVLLLLCEPVIYYFAGIDLADFTIFALLFSMTVFFFFERGIRVFLFDFDLNLPLGIFLIHYPIITTIRYINSKWNDLSLNCPLLFLLTVILSITLFFPLNLLNNRIRILF